MVNKSSCVRSAAAGILALAGLACQPTVTSAGTLDAFIGGSAFLDLNANGKRDAGEPGSYGWVKLSNGGDVFHCGPTSGDGAFGVPVSPGTWTVLAVAPPGFRTTTPVIQVTTVRGAKPALVSIGFVADPDNYGDFCNVDYPKRSYHSKGLGLIETLTRAPGYARFEKLVEFSSWAGALQSDGPFTVFAPGNPGFAGLSAEEFRALIYDGPRASAFVGAHIVKGRISAAALKDGMLLTALNGAQLSVSVIKGNIRINGVPLATRDLAASNGVIHKLDGMLAVP